MPMWSTCDEAQRTSAVSAGVMVRLVAALRGEAAESAAKALAGLTSCGDLGFDLRAKRAAVAAGCVPPLVTQLSSLKGAEAEWAAAALHSLAGGEDVCKASLVSAGALPALVPLLSSADGHQALHAGGAFHAIARGDYACKAACISAGAVPKLVSLLASQDWAAAEKASGALWALAMGDDECKAACVSAGAIPALSARAELGDTWADTALRHLTGLTD